MGGEVQEDPASGLCADDPGTGLSPCCPQRQFVQSLTWRKGGTSALAEAAEAAAISSPRLLHPPPPANWESGPEPSETLCLVPCRNFHKTGRRKIPEFVLLLELCWSLAPRQPSQADHMGSAASVLGHSEPCGSPTTPVCHGDTGQPLRSWPGTLS